MLSAAYAYLEIMTSYKKIRLRQSMRISLKNNRAKFHPDRIWNHWANNNNEMISDMGSVSGLKT